MRIALYMLTIILANILTSALPPFLVTGFLIPPGTLLIGLTFIMRDLVQIQYGKRMTYQVIGGALILSAISTVLMGNGVQIVIASAVSFLLSETLDTEVFSRLKASLSKRVLFSGTIGSILDSIVFSLVAGFPAAAMLGQIVVKLVLQVIGATAIKGLTENRFESAELARPNPIKEESI